MRPLPIALVLLLAPVAARADGTLRRQMEVPTTSLHDAQGLGAGELGFGLAVGFPYVQAQAALGLFDRLQLDLQVDTLYGAATQLGFGPKVRLLGGPTGFALALRLRGQWTFFRNPAFEESPGSARHLTGLRNWGLEPALVLSGRSARGSLFGVVRYQATYASEAELSGPLSGVPDAWGGNVGLYIGGELNTRSLVHVYGLAGLDLHLRQTDSRALPRVELGFTFPG